MGNKIDVAIQSYKKPESLIYTCLSLKEHCGNHIDTIYIRDDQSNDGTIKYYQQKGFLEVMAPIKIIASENKKKAGLYYSNKKMMSKRFNNVFWYIYDLLRGRKPALITEDDIRYQWGIKSTDKRYIYLTHDDVEFRGDIIGLYLDEIQKGNHAIVGELGQCWRCPAVKKCGPEKICSGYRPSRMWPQVGKTNIRTRRACRMNEWSCLVDADIAKKVARENAVFFGTYEDRGDIGAYWFDFIVKKGYSFSDPLCGNGNDLYYKHCWQGFPGFSTEIYGGSNKYDGEKIKQMIKKKYGLAI